ncbi:hemerythrin domain-containing protein [Nocardioides sp. zg-ZUI104]|uniref:hemerythrin domain-containing protein n=1 Tax=Nocardioides faecalis TaxID=2803858 RepID=UPI001BCC56DA|nr:hemerythrin domain-containing protein [Nocardioides faecalis]MBS4752975.1 hemerythrin domain-containing protein [Nocardioides faecalis]
MTSTPPGGETAAPLLLPGQAAAPAGPCDMSGMYLMHHGFRRDLDDFIAAATHTPPGERATWAAISQRWERFAHLLHEHHDVEDRVLWPLLTERVTAAGDTAGAGVLEAMEAEHALIDPLLGQVRDQLDRILVGDEQAKERARTALVAVLARTREVLDDHLAHEERDAVALVQRHVAGEEWEALERKEFRGRPSMSELRFQLPWMVHEVPDEVVRPLVKASGAPFAVLLRLSRRGFARQQRAAFRYVP